MSKFIVIVFSVLISLHPLIGKSVKQLITYPQEKVYLQIDKPRYLAGERIWFSVYVVDAVSHHPVTDSPVYIEVIDCQGTMVLRVLVKADSVGGSGGYILLDEKMKETIQSGYIQRN